MIRVPLVGDQWQDATLVIRSKRTTQDVSTIVGVVAKHISLGQLNVDALVRYRTIIKTTARKNAGGGEILLARLFASPGTEHAVPLEMSMLNEQEQNQVMAKGTVYIRAKSMPMIDNVLPVPIEVDDAWITQHEQNIAVQHRQRRDELRSLMFAWQALFESYPQTFKSAHDINCYIERMRDGGILPAIVYMMQAQPASVDHAFFENALSVVLRRERMDRDTLAGLPTKSLRVCNVAIQMLSLWSNYAPYVSDQCWAPLKNAGEEPPKGGLQNVAAWLGLRAAMKTAFVTEMKHFSMEEFELADLYGSDDCEGLGFVIIRLCAYLLSLPRTALSPALARVAELLEKYVPLLLLCGVTSGDLSADFASLVNYKGQMGAHMFALFVPYGRVMRMMRRCNHATRVLRDSPADLELLEDDTRNLPVLFGEGTGLELPLPLNLPETKQLLLPTGFTGDKSAEISFRMLSQQVASPSGAHNAVAFVAHEGGMVTPTELIGSTNPAFSNNSLWMTDFMQMTHGAAF